MSSLLLKIPKICPAPSASPAKAQPKSPHSAAETPFFAPQVAATERTRTPQEPFSRQIEAGLAPHPQNTALERSAATQRPLAPPERKNGLSGFSVFSLEALLDLFRFRVRIPLSPAQRAGSISGRAKRAPCGGYAGWVGDRVRDRAGRGREPPKRRCRGLAALSYPLALIHRPGDVKYVR